MRFHTDPAGIPLLSSDSSKLADAVRVAARHQNKFRILDRNHKRDLRNASTLKANSWTVIAFWKCKSPSPLDQRIGPGAALLHSQFASSCRCSAFNEAKTIVKRLKAGSFAPRDRSVGNDRYEKGLVHHTYWQSSRRCDVIRNRVS